MPIRIPNCIATASSVPVEQGRRALGFPPRLGIPTASPDALDVDAILAGQAALAGQPGDTVTIPTTKRAHLRRCSLTRSVVEIPLCMSSTSHVRVDAELDHALGDRVIQRLGVALGKIAGMRRPIVPHAPRRWRRAVGSYSPRMARLLRMSNFANLSKEGLPHDWPLDKR